MRRGLMVWNAEELPKAALAERLAGLRAEMRRQKLDAMLFYTTSIRPDAVTWLTGFTPYWSDGVLMVRPDGEPAFATALSKRVANWIRSTQPVGDIVNTPRPGSEIGKRLAESGAKRVGVLEFDTLPSGFFDDITAAAPTIELVDATAPYTAARRSVDATEAALLSRADGLARAALETVDPAIGEAGSIVGAVERAARLGGAEEAYIACAPDLDADRRLGRVSGAVPLGRRFAVRASVAYKGSWVRRTRSFSADPGDRAVIERADAWFAETVETLLSDTPLGGQIDSAARRLGATLVGWTAEACTGSYPLQVVASAKAGGETALPDASLAVITVNLTLDGVPWTGTAPVIVGRDLLGTAA
jgi:hypothetical protein